MTSKQRDWKTHQQVKLPLGFENQSVTLNQSSDLDSILWRTIRSVADAPNMQPASLKGPGNEAARTAFREFVQQGYEYWCAAKEMPRPNNALALYYSILQLAKAEIVLHDPSKVVGVPIDHGLTTTGIAPGAALDDIKAKVKKLNGSRNGVFHELYRARYGTKPDAGGDWSLSEIVTSLLDSSWEMKRLLGVSTSTGLGVDAFIVADDDEAWGLIDPHDNPAIHTTEIAALMKDSGLEICKASRAAPNNHMHQELLQTSATVTRTTDGPIAEAEAESAAQTLLASLATRAGGSPFGRIEIGPLMSGTTAVAPPMARHAGIHLLSSLVRYSPATLLDPDARWLADVFLEDSPSPLLQSACMHITGIDLSAN